MNKSDSTKWMGISTAGGRDGRRNDPRSSAPLSDGGGILKACLCWYCSKFQKRKKAIGFCGLTLSPRSSAGQLCPSSAHSSRNHTRARPSGRNRRPACAHGRERKESSQVLTPQFCKEQGARIKKGGGMPRIILRSHRAPPDVSPVGQCAGSTRLYSTRSQTWSCACVLREKAHSSA